MYYSPLPSEPIGPVVNSSMAFVIKGLLRIANVLLAAVASLILCWSAYAYFYLHNTEWFTKFTGGLGVFIFIITLIGFSGTRTNSLNTLTMYIMALALFVVTVAGILLLLFTKNPWIEKLPGDDPSWKAFREFCIGNERLVKIVGLAVIGCLLVALALTSWLHSILQDSIDEWMERRVEARDRMRAELRLVAERNADDTDSLWAQRMKEKYGVDRAAVGMEENVYREIV